MAAQPRIPAVLTILATLLLLPGCFVGSVYPFYEERDLVNGHDLLGTWELEGGCLLTVTESSDGEKYILEVSAPLPPNDSTDCSDTPNKFEGHVLQIGDDRFLDVLPHATDDFVAPLHLLLKIQAEGDSLSLEPLNWDWLSDAIAGKKLRLEARVDGDKFGDDVILTSPTRKLREFVQRNVATPELFETSTQNGAIRLRRK